MKSNVGNIDKRIRLLLAIVIGTVGIYFKSWWGLVALVPLLTSITSFCPLYSILGINSCAVKKTT